MTKNEEEIPSTKPSEIEALINRIEKGEVQQRDRDLEVRLLRLVLVMLRVIESKNASIKRLKRLLFGKGSEKQSETPAHENEGSSQPAESDNQAGDKSAPQREPSDQLQSDEPHSKPGHGRLGANQYQASTTVWCEHVELHPGGQCPHKGCGGRLYDTGEPQVLIRLEGRPLIGATRYEQQVLRCSACQARFAASLPQGVPPEKYDPTADASLAVMKYGAGLPWYRSSRLQKLMGVPLPASTQFERCAEVAEAVHPVYLEMERQAAAGEVVHIDDTGVKILACLKENQTLREDERKGLHTTGIGARAGRRQIALYNSGRRHAGENLRELARKRPPELTPPIVMADAEAKNWTAGCEQVSSKCLQHGRRQFTEIEAEFPFECRRVLDDLRSVYRIEAETRGMSAAERLRHHQDRSGPILAGLREWITSQMENRQVEPNSGLGRAMNYLLRHWSGLTRFLEVEGAPLDNNFAERILKRAVLHRKNALFYKTEYGAAVGDILMSVIETCALNEVNPFDYLTVVARQARQVRLNPAEWLPWNYQERKSKAA